MDHQAGNPQASQRQGDQSTPDVWGRDDPEEGQGQQRVSGPLSLQLLASQMAQPGTLVPVQAPPRPPKPPRRKNRLLILLGGIILIALFWQPIFALLQQHSTPPPIPTQATEVFTIPTQAATPPPFSQGTAVPVIAGAFREFAVPAGGNPRGIAVGSDGAIWFTLPGSSQIGRLTPDGQLQEFGVASYSPMEIVAGPDGALWFTLENSSLIGRVSIHGTFSLFRGASSPIADLTNGPDGNLWFTEPESNSIGWVSPIGVLEEFSVPTPDSYPLGITQGPDGALWFTEYHSGKVGRMTPDGQISEFAVPAGSGGPTGIITGPDKRLWLILSLPSDGSDRLLSMTTTGAIQVIQPPFLIRFGSWLTVGPDDNLWFTDSQRNNIGDVTPAGSFNEVALPTPGSQPLEVVAGPKGTLWFTEFNGNKIGEYKLNG